MRIKYLLLLILGILILTYSITNAGIYRIDINLYYDSPSEFNIFVSSYQANYYNKVKSIKDNSSISIDTENNIINSMYYIDNATDYNNVWNYLASEILNMSIINKNDEEKSFIQKHICLNKDGQPCKIDVRINK